jgi:hypothetical protein
MQVGMPVEKLPGGLDGNNGGGKSVPFRVFPEERGKSLPGAQGKFGEKPSPIPECQAQDLGECEDEMPVGDGADHLLPDEFGPQGGAFSGARRAESPLLAGEGNEIFVSAGVAPDARETALREAAPEESLYGFSAAGFLFALLTGYICLFVVERLVTRGRFIRFAPYTFLLAILCFFLQWKG